MLESLDFLARTEYL